MGNPRIGQRRVEQGLIRLATVDGPLHPVVDVEDLFLGAIAAVRSDVLPRHDRKSLHDAVDVIVGHTVWMEDSSVEFAAQKEATGFVPTEGRAIAATVLGEGLQIPSGVGEFEGTGKDPTGAGTSTDPSHTTSVCSWRKDWNLFYIKVCEPMASGASAS